ncbi:MAG TPA: universal stress protein [Candidatus Acidoferrales bacterium]|nr:universal stress protein [Candidatus Acidoferrales bacterium]
MSAAATAPQISLNHILYLTDFSESSRSALGLAKAVARGYGSHIHALHVLLPPPVMYSEQQSAAVAADAWEEAATANMKRLESDLSGIPHECSMESGADPWTAIRQQITVLHADLIILGTHGRTGIPRLLLGSVAEEIFRQAEVPVLTIGPYSAKNWDGSAEFRKILLATDFGPDSRAAASYAISFAQAYEGRLDLLHVIRARNEKAERAGDGRSAAAAMHELHEVVPDEEQLRCKAHSIVQFGDPAEQILEAAKEFESDLIVMGVRSAPNRMGRATHLERPVAHRVVIRAACPVLTVRDVRPANTIPHAV